MMRLYRWMWICGLAGSAFGAPPLGGDREKIISPREAAESQWFDCTDKNLWTQVASSRQGVAVPDIGVDSVGKGLKFVWPGGPAAGILESSQRLEITRGEGEEVRIVWEIALDQVEFEAMLRPVVRQFDDRGNLLGTAMMAPEWLYQLSLETAPDKVRRFAWKWKPPEGTVSISPALEFAGNAIVARLESIRLEPVQPKPKWNPANRALSRIPAVRYDEDDAVPKEDKPKISDEEVTQLLEKRPWAEPRVERRDGRVRLTIGGKEEPFAIHMAPLAGVASSSYREMAEAGFNITTITIKTGPEGDTAGAVNRIWLGEGQYNFEPIAEAIRYVLARAPETYVMLHLVLNVYNDWGFEHPDDVLTNAAGEKGICNWSRIIRYGGEPPSGNEFWEASNHSERFREDGAKMLYDLGKWLSSVPEGKVVIGAYINGSADGQWLFSNELEFGDYSRGALNAFRKYLREKYQTDAALTAAWGFPVTFQTAEMPTIEERRRQKGPDLQKGRSPLMEHNGENAQSADYNAFLSVSNTRRQIAFSKGLKEGSGGRLLTGSYWPTLPAAYPLSHTDFLEMLESDDVNFISRGGMLGAVFHGKLTAGEFDLRNVKSGLDAWLDYDHPFHAKSQAEFRRQVLEGFCRELASGGGFHLWDMWGGWFWHPDTMAILKEGLAMAKFLKDPPPLGDNYVGVFVDDEAANHINLLGQSYSIASVQRTFQTMGWGWASGWERTGLPVRFFLQEDALNPDLVVPKVSIFLNPLTMTPEEGEKIKARFCRDGRVVVFMLAPGLAAPGDSANPSKITGFPIQEDGRTINRSLVFEDVSDPLLKDVRPGSMLGIWDEQMSMAWYNNVAGRETGEAKVLARYGGTDIPGMLVRRDAQATVVWIGAPGCLSPALIRNFAREAGLTPLIENGSSIILGSGLLGVVGTAKGGPQAVRLPEHYEIENCITGQPYEVKDGVLTFALQPSDIYGDVAIFAVKGAKK